MGHRLVWATTLAFGVIVVCAGAASAQYRGYGYSYDSAPDYYDGADPTYPLPRLLPPPAQRDPYEQSRDYAPPPRYGQPQVLDPGDTYRAPPEPLYVDPQDGGRARGASDYDLGENANRRTMLEVQNPTREGPGTIVIDTASRHLYLVEQGGRALQYGIGVGREGFAWKGEAKIERKAEWPDWIPPSDMLKRRPDLPQRMAGGIENPLGARALYLFKGNKDTLFRIHGTNEPDTIGKAVSSGCIRMMNADVIDLYQRVPVGTRVKVL